MGPEGRLMPAAHMLRLARQLELKAATGRDLRRVEHLMYWDREDTAA